MFRAPLVLSALIASIMLAPAWADDAANATSPHAEAIRLVLQTQQEQIHRLDDAEHWWLDTKERTWSARRTVAPGIIDSTHNFLVRYSVDGVIVGTWGVDTRRGTVTPSLPRSPNSGQPR